MTKKHGKKTTKPPRRFNAISIDAFKNTADNDWTFLDNKNLNESLTRETRARIRKRARYEVINNPYAHGAALTICDAVIPSIPRLQITTNEDDFPPDVLNTIEDDFAQWAAVVRLDEKIRSMRFAKFQDGETFAILHSDEDTLDRCGVSLNFYPIDCSRVRSPKFDDVFNVYDQDGIIIDTWGRPVEYTVFNSTDFVGNVTDYETYPAARVLHWFRQSTPEQFRGVSEIAPALLTLAYLRRYTYASVRAAEIAAQLALILKTDAIDANESGEIVTEATFHNGTMAIFPAGFDPQQLKAEQPANGFEKMIDELLGAFGSSVGLPRLIVRKSAGGFTYASAKVDLAEMERFISIERAELKRTILNKLFYAWLKEYTIAYNITPPRLTVDWYFAQSIGDKIDPLKEAGAIEKRFACNITTLAREYALQGLDWQKEIEQKAREAAYIKQLEEKYNVELIPRANVATDSGNDEENNANDD